LGYTRVLIQLILLTFWENKIHQIFLISLIGSHPISFIKYIGNEEEFTYIALGHKIRCDENCSPWTLLRNVRDVLWNGPVWPVPPRNAAAAAAGPLGVNKAQ
jgi:hypothetical protein